MLILALRVALAIGFCVDLFVAIIALFFQSAMGPLFDVPLKDPAATTIVGGEFVVVSLVYLAIFRAPLRYRALLWLVVLDQVFAVVLPAYEIARGNVAATWKTIGPMPFNALLAAVYLYALVKLEPPPPPSNSGTPDAEQRDPGEETSRQQPDELGDDFVYDVAARFNEMLTSNIDAVDNTLLALLAGIVAVALLTIDKARALETAHEYWVFGLLLAAAVTCVVGYFSGRPLLGFDERDGIRPLRFIPDFTVDPQGATAAAIYDLVQAGETNLRVRRFKKTTAILSMLVLLAGVIVLALARLTSPVVESGGGNHPEIGRTRPLAQPQGARS